MSKYIIVSDDAVLCQKSPKEICLDSFIDDRPAVFNKNLLGDPYYIGTYGLHHESLKNALYCLLVFKVIKKSTNQYVKSFDDIKIKQVKGT